jgi:hypothetical protein
MDTAPLSTLADTERVENVVIFLCDNLRFDYLPDEVKQLGVWGPMIAPGTSTYESMPSFTSGLYPSEHGVNQKLLEHGSARLDVVPRLLVENENVGINSETSWITKPSHEKPVLEAHHVREESTLPDMEPPFLYIEHDKGAHSPYGVPFEEQNDDRSFWAGKETSQLRRCYEHGVQQSTERFLSRVRYLRDEGLLDETLVMFLSDHGELLGERRYGGFFGHKTPIVPEIVEVPVSFIGAGLPGGEEFNTVVSGVDIPPTALGAQGHIVEESAHGIDLWNGRPDTDRHVVSETRQPLFLDFAPDGTAQYDAISVWDSDGGYVHHRNSLLIRFLSCQYGRLFENDQANVARQNLSPSTYQSLLETYCRKTIQYGTPMFEWDESIVDAW